MLKGGFLSFLLMVTTISQVQANEIIAVCDGGADGYAYYVEDDIVVPQGKGGWDTDAISAGHWIVVKNDENYDVLFRDATGETHSSSSQGAFITPTYRDKSSLLLAVLYGPTAETILLHKSDVGSVMILVQAKATLLAKGAAYKISCSQLDIR